MHKRSATTGQAICPAPHSVRPRHTRKPLAHPPHDSPLPCPPRCSAGVGISGHDPVRYGDADAALGLGQWRECALAHSAVYRGLGGLRHRLGGGEYRQLLEPARPNAGDGAVSAQGIRHDDLGHADGPVDRRAFEAAHPDAAADQDARAVDGRCALGRAHDVSGDADLRGRGGAVAHRALCAARRHAAGRGAVAGHISRDFGFQQRGLFHLVGQRDALCERCLGAGAADAGHRGRRAGFSGAERGVGALVDPRHADAAGVVGADRVGHAGDLVGGV